VDNKCSQPAQHFDFLGCKISYEDEKDVQQELENFVQLLGILNNAFKPTLDQKSSKVTKIMFCVCLAPFFCVGAKFGPLKKRTSFEIKFSEKQRGSPFFIITKGMKKFWKR
jgi:hypothetical protein